MSGFEEMKKSKFTDLQVIAALKEHDEGRKVADVCRDYGISSPTFYQWRRKYSGMDVAQLKHVRELEAQLARFKRTVAEQMLEIQVLRDLVSKYRPGPGEKRRAVVYTTQEYTISLRRACKLLGTHPSVMLYKAKPKHEKAAVNVRGGV
jgi:putative transposase